MKVSFQILPLLTSLFLVVGCASTNTPTEPVHQPIVEEKSSASEVEKKEEDVPAGTPVVAAHESMEKTKEEIKDTLKFVETATQTKDVVIDVSRDPEECFRTLQEFFRGDYFEHNSSEFWFVTNNGEKVQVFPEDGPMDKCTYGIWMGFRRIIISQPNGNASTEFYVDPASGDLMVHRYHGSKRDNENHKLLGH